jgi:hypothetical protein
VERMLAEAKASGCSFWLLTQLATLLDQFRDVFRVRLGPDPPADVEPLKVQINPFVADPRGPVTPQRI